MKIEGMKVQVGEVKNRERPRRGETLNIAVAITGVYSREIPSQPHLSDSPDTASQLVPRRRRAPARIICTGQRRCTLGPRWRPSQKAHRATRRNPIWCAQYFTHHLTARTADGVRRVRRESGPGPTLPPSHLIYISPLLPTCPPSEPELSSLYLGFFRRLTLIRPVVSLSRDQGDTLSASFRLIKFCLFF
jgi:hypothetical protein